VLHAVLRSRIAIFEERAKDAGATNAHARATDDDQHDDQHDTFLVRLLFLLVAVAIIPNVSGQRSGGTVDETPPDQAYIYSKVASFDAKCAEGLTTVRKFGVCKDAAAFLKVRGGVHQKWIDGPYGCYYYVNNDELHFNVKENGGAVEGHIPICKVPGATTPSNVTPTLPRGRGPGRGSDNEACKETFNVGDRYCDAANNNKECGYDKKPDSKLSDCCAYKIPKSCDDPELCKCLDPTFDWKDVPTTTTTPATTTTTLMATTLTDVPAEPEPTTWAPTTTTAAATTTAAPTTLSKNTPKQLTVGNPFEEPAQVATSAPTPNTWWTATLCVTLGFAFRGL